MKIKVALLFFFLVISSKKNYAQNIGQNKTTTTIKKFDNQNGFKVFSTSNLEFDNLGWLWISGSNLELVNEEIDSRSAIIQRFDGNRFYTVKLPFFYEEKPVGIQLIKRQDGQFYAIFGFKTKQLLYLLNTETLVFKEVKLPFSLAYRSINLFAFKDYFLTFLRKDDETKIFKLDKDLQFSLFTNKSIIQKDRKSIPYFGQFIEFDDHFLVSDERSGVYMYQENGKLIKKVIFEDLGIKNKKLNSLLTIDRWFKQNNKVSVYFNETNQVYEYNQHKRKWTVDENSVIKKKNKFEKKWIYVDQKDNLIEHISNKNGSTFSFNLSDKSQKDPIFFRSKDYFTVTSRDFSKELFFTNKGEFYHYTFEKPIVTTFLENESIRNMLQINKDEVLVSNERRGLYRINLKTKSTEKIQMIFQNQTYVVLQGRAIFEDENYYWSSSNKGIIWIDKKTKIVNEEVYYPAATLIEDKDFIYYGTTKFNLLKFDKKTKKNSLITETTAYDVQGILKIENRFYLACAEGLLIYENKKKQLYKPSKKGNDNFFLSIVNHPKLGILLGSHSGKLFQFNPNDNSFKLLYEDKLKASIATILFDDAAHIWLNTFNGIVSLDENQNLISKYTMNDGLSFYEANRYSALKTKDGHFLVGTLKGLNYFHPDEISKQQINATLKLTSISYFDKEIDKEVEERSPKELANLQSISLSPESKNLHFRFSLFGIYNPEKIKYRYRLNEDSWIDLGNQSEIRLSNLSAGDYTLQVEAIDSANQIIGNPIALAIIIDEFFYKTVWFYIFLLLGISSIGIWYFLENRKKYQLKEKFASQIINTQENERSRVAKELHDSIGQRLLILKKTVAQKENSDIQELKMINDTIDEVRTISHNLHPFQFEKIGLGASLENMLDEFQKSSEVFYSYEIDGIADILSKEKELFIFRMLQECIVNVEKHAKATACNLTVINKERRIEFLMKDNGRGFDVEEAKNKNGIGFKNLQERASYINAYFGIKSNQNKGTIITIKISK